MNSYPYDESIEKEESSHLRIQKRFSFKMSSSEMSILNTESPKLLRPHRNLHKKFSVKKKLHSFLYKSNQKCDSKSPSKLRNYDSKGKNLE